MGSSERLWGPPRQLVGLGPEPSGIMRMSPSRAWGNPKVYVLRGASRDGSEGLPWQGQLRFPHEGKTQELAGCPRKQESSSRPHKSSTANWAPSPGTAKSGNQVSWGKKGILPLPSPPLKIKGGGTTAADWSFICLNLADSVSTRHPLDS